MAFVPPVTLEGRHVRLEPMAHGRIDAIVKALSAAAADGAMWESKVTAIPRPDEARAYVLQALKELDAGVSMPFVTVDRASDRAVGTTRYMNIEAPHRRLEIGTTWIGKSFQRTAINTEAKYLMLRHAFETLDCIAVDLRTHEKNVQSRAAIERLGAKLDGLLRNHRIMPDGSLRNTATYSIIAAEWPAVKARLEARPPTFAMLIDFFLHLKAARLPVSTREFLTLLEALDKRVVSGSLDDFYHLARATLIKDEAQFDRYDLAFATYFKGVDAIFDIRAGIPEDWLRREFVRHLSDEDKKRIEALGGWDKLMETLKKRLEEQKARHAGGSKWIGTGGTSPFGAYGYNPEGVRIGGEGGNRSAVKVWDERNFRNLDGDVELNTRNIKVALRKLRRFAREGVPEELDMEGTIEGTAKNAGWLDLHLQPERRNRVKVLLFLDVGGSMDPHVRVCEELFSAARTEFRHLESFYFHNCVYDHVWRDNSRRRTERVGTWDVLNKYGPDWKLIFVGDAAMSPYELLQEGGSVEYANDEPGALWLKRLAEHYRRVIWWNPEPPRAWEYTRSTQIVLNAIGTRMFPLTLDGIARGIDALRH